MSTMEATNCCPLICVAARSSLSAFVLSYPTRPVSDSCGKYAAFATPICAVAAATFRSASVISGLRSNKFAVQAFRIAVGGQGKGSSEIGKRSVHDLEFLIGLPQLVIVDGHGSLC
jgi:hypothetical protein